MEMGLSTQEQQRSLRHYRTRDLYRRSEMLPVVANEKAAKGPQIWKSKPTDRRKKFPNEYCACHCFANGPP